MLCGITGSSSIVLVTVKLICFEVIFYFKLEV